MHYLLYLGSCYVVGWIMTGYFVIRLMEGKDIRSQGSGNIGALNSGRTAGAKAFILTFIGDSLKGGAVVFAGKYMNLPEWIVLLGLITVIAGHIWPLPFRFKGGKGAATFLGGLLVYNPISLPFLIIVSLVFYLLIREFTIAGLIALSLWPIFQWFQGESLLLFKIILVSIIIWAHRTNIKGHINKLKK